MYQGISLQSAPPFGVVCAFFINAQCYLIIAGVLFGFVTLFPSTYSPQLIALTHCFGLGFFALTMFGSLSQMLPVLAGITLKVPKLTCTLTLLFVNVGIIAFLWAFLSGEKIAFFIAMLALGLGVGGFAISTLAQMLKIRHFNATVSYMFAALLALIIALLCGEALLASYVGLFGAVNHLILVLCHLSVAIFGWIMLLIIGVILQVLPMFYVAPSFEKSFFAYLIPLLYAILIGFLLFLYFAKAEFSHLLPLIFATLCLATSIYAIKTLLKRRRKNFDSTMFLWFFAFANLAFSGVSFILSLANDIFISLVGLFLPLGFVCSIIFAMYYKIIPFLAWFHLSYNGIFELPNLRLIVPPRLAKAQIALFLLGYALCVIMLLLGSFLPTFNTQILSLLCGFCFAGCGVLLIIAVLKAYKVYFVGLKKVKMP